MKFEKDTSGIERYIALDIHKEYALVGGQNARQEWVMQPRRVEMGKFREWAGANLRVGDAVVIETTTNVWDIYDIVAPQVSYALVAHAGAVRQIAEARVKTDKKDIGDRERPATRFGQGAQSHLAQAASSLPIALPARCGGAAH